MRPRFPTCFVSCSLSSEDTQVVSWFERILVALEFDPKKAGDTPQSRPPHEKIVEMIRASDCFVAVVTRRKKVAGTPDSYVAPGWVQNEIGMAHQEGKQMAIFLEDGVDLEGIAPRVADYVPFKRDDLGAAAPKVVTFLINLARAVRGSSGGRIEDLPTARALSNELASFAVLVKTLDKPRYFPWHLAYTAATSTGRFYMLPASVQEKVKTAYATIGSFEALVPTPPIFGEGEPLPPAKVEEIKGAREAAFTAAVEAVLELLPVAYPEEYNASLGKGEAPPKLP